jgi:hypothetical protein
MGQRQLHLLASHMRLKPGATADQVRTFPHVQPRPSPLRFHRYQCIARFCAPARPPSARMASALHANARHRWPSAFAQHSALTTFRYLSRRFLTGLNVSFLQRGAVLSLARRFPC